MTIRADSPWPSVFSWLLRPLISGDAVVGTLTLYSPVRNAFTEDQSRLLELLAPHAAQAISRVRRNGTGAEPGVAPTQTAAANAPELRLVRAR